MAFYLSLRCQLNYLFTYLENDRGFRNMQITYMKTSEKIDNEVSYFMNDIYNIAQEYDHSFN